MKKLGMLIAGVLAAVSLGLTTVGPATAAAPLPAAVYPPNVTVTITITPNPAAPGATVVITFTGCTAGESVTITMTRHHRHRHLQRSVRLRAHADGRRPARPRRPHVHRSDHAGHLPGHSDRADERRHGQRHPERSSPPTAGLPSTGSDNSSTLQIAALLVVVGTGGRARRLPAPPPSRLTPRN